MPWSTPFDFPVPGFRTLRDAATYITKLPKAEQAKEHWQTAMDILIKAAEVGKGWTMMAHMAMLQAMYHGKPEPVKEPRRKAVKKYRIVR